MEELLAAFLGVFFELILQIFAEILTELGFRAVASVFQRGQVHNPALAALGHFLVGAAVGGVSLFFFHHALLHHSNWRIVNLFTTPVLAGFSMSALGAVRARRGEQVLRLDSFFYGFLFAFGMALVRFLYADKT